MAVEELVEDIFQGIKFAVQKGYTLEQAMKSFHNAGYVKEDIETAAQKFQTYQAQGEQIPIKKVTEKKEVKKETKTEEKTKQKVSNYEHTQRPKNNMKLAIIFIVLGIVVISAIAGLFIFFI